MRASEFTSKKLVVFDIDDTLVNTETKVHVVKDDQIIRSLNSHDFTHYKLQPGEKFDFEDFRNAREFFEKSKPIIPMMRQLKQDIATGNKVVMVTARADFDDKELFLDTFRKYGIDIDKVHVYRAGNSKQGTTEERKKAIIKHLLDKDDYSKAIMYDDAKPNLNTFIELKQDHPRTKFYAWHVSPEGAASEYMREGVVAEKKRRRKPRWAAYGPGPYGGYGYLSGYSGDGSGGDGGGVGEDAMRDIIYTKPNLENEWEEAARYPEFVSIGKEAWIKLAKAGKAVTITSAKDINNTDAADPDSFKLLNKDKQSRALSQIKQGSVEMPIVAVYPDGRKELIAGNTRLTATLAKYGKSTLWAFKVPDEVARLTENFANGHNRVDFKKNLLTILQQKYPDIEFNIQSDRVESADGELIVIADTADQGSYVGCFMWDVDTGPYKGALGPAIKQTTNQLLQANPGKKPALFIGGDNENPQAWANIADKLNYKLITDDDESEEGMAENFADGKNPQDKGDSKRHGIPKKASISALKKIRSSDTASSRKKQLAHWQINMRQGRQK